MSVSYWLDHSKNNSIDVDIAIIGGGIAGYSTAYWLQKNDPSLKIAIIEKGEMGSGASGRNAGFITCGSVEHFSRLVQLHGEDLALKIWRFSEVNLSLLTQEILSNAPVEVGFLQKGSFSLASTQIEFDELKRSSQLMKKLKIDTEVFSGSEIEKRLGAVNFVGGIKYKGDASIDPIALLQCIKNKFKSSVKELEYNEVYEIADSGQGKIIKTNQTQIKAQLIVLATNSYSPLLFDFFKNKIFPTRGQILITEPVQPFMEGPCYANFVLDYFRQLPNGRLIIGGFRQLQKDVELGYSDEISPIIQNALEDFIIRHIPQLAHKRITHRWSGVMGFSVDGQPMIGSLPEDQKTFFLGGFTAHGLGLAFHSAKCMVDLLFERQIPDFISAKRFN